MSHFNVSLIVWAKSRDGVRKPQFLKRKESRSGSNRGPSAYQPTALPLGHTGSQLSHPLSLAFISTTYSQSVSVHSLTPSFLYIPRSPPSPTLALSRLSISIHHPSLLPSSLLYLYPTFPLFPPVSFLPPFLCPD